MTKKAISNLAESSETPSTRCFFDIDFNGHSVGRIIFELFNDLCPKTCENFRALCTGKSFYELKCEF